MREDKEIRVFPILLLLILILPMESKIFSTQITEYGNHKKSVLEKEMLSYEEIPVDIHTTKEKDISPCIVKDTPITEKDIVFVGDSRMVGQEISVISEVTYICKGGVGYSWLILDDTTERIETAAESAKVMVFNLGVNGFQDPSCYADYVFHLKQRFPNLIIIYMSINPIQDDLAERYGYSEWDYQVVDYNERLKKALPESILWLDTYSYLVEDGYDTFDGIHYSAETYQKIYHYTMTYIQNL